MCYFSYREIYRILNEVYVMFNKNEFDIFGAMKDDSTQVRYLNNKSHREHEKISSKC